MSTLITDEFDDILGRYLNYETDDLSYQDNLLTRKHKNIRTFSNDVETVPLVIADLTAQMTDYDNWEMGAFEDTRIIHTETWSGGVFGPDAALNDRPSLKLTLPIGTTSTESNDNPVDLAGFSDTDELSIALPNFPATSLDLNNSYITLRSDTDTINLSLGDRGLGNGNVEAKWSLSEVFNIASTQLYSEITGTYDDISSRTYDEVYHGFTYALLSGIYGEMTGTYGDMGTLISSPINEITSVEFTFEATAACTVTIAALRILSPDWTPTTLDINTLSQRLEPTVTRIGTIPTTTFPKIWRTSETPGTDDPLPIDTKLALNFYTGAATQDNKISFFFRGRREDFLTQLDLDGVYTGTTLTFGTHQAALDTYGVQPDYGRAMYNPHPQEDYDAMSQSTLDTLTQAEMERQPDLISAAWLEVELRFGTTDQVTIRTTETTVDTEVILPASFDPDKHYLASVEVVDDSVWIRVYNLDEFGQVDRASLVFDSTQIHNDFLYKRRKGRVGWAVDLQDGDAYVNSVRSRGLVFNEYISRNFESLTPVEGARLFAGATPDTFAELLVLPYNGATTETDTNQARSKDGSTKVTAPVHTGVQSQLISFDDFENSEITFDLYPQGNTAPELYLHNMAGLYIPLGMPKLVSDQWNTVRVQPLRASLEQTGNYGVLLIQESDKGIFWVDNFSLRQRSVRWSGRSTLFDPWKRNRNEWTEFQSLVNNELDGIMFPRRDFFLQIRGQALQQTATIDRVYAKPKYAELGRLVWEDVSSKIGIIPPPRVKHQVTIGASPQGSEATFSTAYGTYPPAGQTPTVYHHAINTLLTFTATIVSGTNTANIVEYYWDFGDGTEASTTSNTVTHTYKTATLDTIAHVRTRDANGDEAWASLNMMLV